MNKPTKPELDLLAARAKKSVWVDSDEQLAEIANYWKTQTVLAVDTEFCKTDTYYAIPGLIQIADDKACYLLDPKAIKDFSPMVEAFENPDILKVLHAPAEDLDLFHHCYGVKPSPIYDTQLGAAFLGLGQSMGLVRMLDHYLDVKMSKAETTSNWLRRPLSISQEHYAALDVTYLKTIYEIQAAQLAEQGKLDWVMAESAYLVKCSGDDHQPEFYPHLKYGNLSHWPLEKQLVLKQMLRLREKYARSADVPRTRVMKNDVLIAIIESWPTNMGELAAHQAFPRRILRLHGQAILKFFTRAKKHKGIEMHIWIPRPDDIAWRRRVTKKIKAYVRSVGEEIDVQPELLLKNKDIEGIFLTRAAIQRKEYRLVGGLPLWRRKLLSDRVIEIIETSR